MLRLTAVRGSGALYVSGVAKRPPRQKQAAERAERARRRQRERRDGLTSGGSADLVEYRGWVGSVLERARRELGVGDSAWSQIEQACRGNHRFRLASWRPSPAQAEVFARTAVLEETRGGWPVSVPSRVAISSDCCSRKQVWTVIRRPRCTH